MRRFTKTIMSLLAGGILMPLAAQAELAGGECYFGSYDRLPETEEHLLSLGYRTAGTYAVGYKIPGSLAGAKLEGVLVPLWDTTALDNLYVWASKGLAANTTEDKSGSTASYTFTPDVKKDFVAQTTAKVKLTEVRFDEPVIVPEGGIYMGYSFRVKAATTDYAMYPILTVKNPAYVTEFPLMTFSSQYTWSDNSKNSEEPGSVWASAVVGILSGAPENGAYFASPASELNVSPQKSTVTLPLVNMGSKGVESIEYTILLEGNSKEGNMSFGSDAYIMTARQIGVADEVNIKLPKLPATGKYTMKVNVDKVNGIANGYTLSETSIPVNVVSRVAYKRPLVEESTCVKCGYCTRGFYGMEVLKKYHPGAIMISYHNTGQGYDPMVCSTAFPFSGGNPTGLVDRYDNVNNYSDRKSAGFMAGWEAHLNDYTPADIWVEANWANDEETLLDATCRLNFVESNPAARYRVDFALVQDGMTGTPAAGWSQTNYYSGDYDAFSEPEWQKFGEGRSTITGLVYDDVCIAMGSRGMKGITGSVPQNIEADTDYTYSIQFDLDKCILVGGTESLVQDKEKLKVVAILIDVNSGRVLNAALYHVGPSGIDSIDASEGAYPVAYYDLAGRLVENPAKGIYIVKLSNGKVQKRVIR